MREYKIDPVIADPQADSEEAKRLYGIEFTEMGKIKNMDAVILAVSHKEFCGMPMERLDEMFADDKKVLLDLKGLLERKDYEAAGYYYWRL